METHWPLQTVICFQEETIQNGGFRVILMEEKKNMSFGIVG